MAFPVIGITVYSATNESGNPISAVQTKYIEAIVQAGGAPFLIPNHVSAEMMQDLYARLDGILFTGGGDLALNLYNGTPHPSVGLVDEARDAAELPLVCRAADDGKPFLGVCRGLQLVNVALGGTLYSHILDQHEGAHQHDWHVGYPRDYLAHEVRVQADSKLAKIVAEPVLQVNSLHHQGIEQIAPQLVPVAYAPDGLIEGVELPGHLFGVAVQWHPEWLTGQAAARNLFRALVDAARK
jgi:putative glutamine amidotransferase